MIYTNIYHSPLGDMLLASDKKGLVGAWFTDQKYFAFHLPEERMEKETNMHKCAKLWLGIYFLGEVPPFPPPIHLMGTEFQLAVWNKLLEIPYGQTVTYGELAKEIGEARGTPRLSAQAIGGAVGHNPISLIVPCHRVVGADGSLTGYAGGVERKAWLLNFEKALESRKRSKKRGKH